MRNTKITRRVATLALMCSFGTISEVSAKETDYSQYSSNKMITLYNRLTDKVSTGESIESSYMKSLTKIDEPGFSIQAEDNLKFSLNYREDGILDNISADITEGEVDWVFSVENKGKVTIRKRSLLLGDIWSIYKTSGKVDIELKKADTKNTSLYNTYEYYSERKNYDRHVKEQFGWVYDNYKNTWGYINASDNLRMRDRWFKEDTTWYHFNEQCEMSLGWVYSNNGWYYLDTMDGTLCKGWRKVDNKWYYLNSVTGIMETGWKFDNNSWYYLGSNGAMVTSTVIDNILINEYGIANI